MGRLFTFLTGAVVLCTVALPQAAFSAEKEKVFFLLPNSTTTRFENRDAPFFIEAMLEKAPDVELTLVNAQGDPAEQQRQVENAIAQGADLLLFTSADANLAAGHPQKPIAS
ncbi:hypothetical protein TH25_25495, partial [Thalassospira profundimaris]